MNGSRARTSAGVSSKAAQAIARIAWALVVTALWASLCVPPAPIF